MFRTKDWEMAEKMIKEIEQKVRASTVVCVCVCVCVVCVMYVVCLRMCDVACVMCL